MDRLKTLNLNGTKYDLCPLHVQAVSKTLTNNYVIIADSEMPGYKLVAVQNIRSDAQYFVKGISRRPGGGYTVFFDGANGNTFSLWLYWMASNE